MGEIVQGGDEGEDGRAGVGGPVHVADVDFVERGFADAEHQRALLFEANVGGTLDEMAGVAVGDAGQGSDAARQDDHSVGGIGAAGDVGSDVGIGLLVDFAGSVAEHALDEFVAAGEGEFFGQDAQGAVRGDEVDGLNALVALDCQQELLEKQRSAGAGGGDGQVLREMVGQIRLLKL